MLTKTVSKKALYRELKAISDDVMKNKVSYTVIQNSRPAFKIVPIDQSEKPKYQKSDISKFIFNSKGKETNLAENYKDILYGHNN